MPHRSPWRVGSGLGDNLCPVHFRCPEPRPVSCYAFFEGWLLLSPPPGCLRFQTSFVFTRRLYLGPLTRISVVPVAVMSLIAMHPFARFYGVMRLRSLVRGRGGEAPTHRSSALQHRLPPRTRSCEILLLEQAIPGLDWLFTPRPESHKRVARQHCYGRPSGFPLTSTCSGLDRPASRFRSVAGCRGTTPVPAGHSARGAKG